MAPSLRLNQTAYEYVRPTRSPDPSEAAFRLELGLYGGRYRTRTCDLMGVIHAL